MHWSQLLKHLSTSPRAVSQAFSAHDLDAIEQAIARAEQHHGGQIMFAVEGALSINELWHGKTAHDKAHEVFLQCGCWDTEHNNGVLIYLLLADRDFVIIADRGIHRYVGKAGWEAVCQQMEQAFRNGQFLQGVLYGIETVGALLQRHFPRSDGNEIPNKPIVLT